MHFIEEQPDGEQVYFSYSEDGLHWKDLNAGLPVLRSELGEKGGGIRFWCARPRRTSFIGLPRISELQTERAGPLRRMKGAATLSFGNPPTWCIGLHHGLPGKGFRPIR